MTDHDVVVAGGGPTGMMLASELALAGVDVVIVERRATQDLDGSRAGGLHSRTLEILDQRGIVDRFLAEGQTHPAVGYGQMFLPIGDFPTRHNYLLALWQRDFERIMANYIEERGIRILRGRDVVGFEQDEDGVHVHLSDGATMRAKYLAGCDGGRSIVRKTAGIDFPGLDPSMSFIIAEVEMTDHPPIGLRREGGGIGPVNRDGRPGPFGVVLREPEVEHANEPTMDDLCAALNAAFGTDFGAHNPTRLSRFTDVSRQAATYRKGRVLLAGDAAHIHPPFGGQGLNIGVQDAMNLGWKLAQVIRGTSPHSLLDTYHAERHPVGARVLHSTNAQSALSNGDDRHMALRETLAQLVAMDEPRRYIAGMISGLDVHYNLGEGHPLLGRRIPDVDLQTPGGATRTYPFLHDGRGVLLNFGQPGGIDITPWANRVQFVDATCNDAWHLPVIGEVPAPPAVLVRPDGYVAWTGEVSDPGLRGALEKWFGPGKREP